LRRLGIMIITRFKATFSTTLKESRICVRIVLRNKAIVKIPVVRFYVPEDEKLSLMPYCSTVHFCRITSIYQPTNAHIISHKTLLKHFKTLRHVSILSDNHQGALLLAKVILQYSQLNSYLQTRCCGSISCCVVEQWLGVRRFTTHT